MTLSKNGKRLGRPRGSKTKPVAPKDNRRLNQAKIISELEGRVAQYDFANCTMRREINMLNDTVTKLRKELAEAQIAVLDGVAVIRYLEKKVYDLVKAEQK